ncbi:MAG: ABC transporter ATP-binding protein [Eubacteriaceae bacterium]|nr:ABC transporter ATP-binding protein [Eubacteriaceae bacterium]
MKLSANSVTVTLSRKDIVKQVSVQVADGQFVGLLGPNGSGKTTLLKSIYRVLKPSAGIVTLDGTDIREMSYRESSKRMGVVSQFTNMSFDFTVEEIVLMGRAPHKKAFSQDTEEDYLIAEEALRKVDMLDFRDRMFMTLSGGEKQRILLARTLAQQVDILILDEPTNHLDIKYQIQIMDVVKSLGKGVLSALHDLNLTLMYCSYVYVLKNGRIVAHGPTEEVITKDLIRDVYEVDCEVERDSRSGKMRVTFYSMI